MRGYPLYNFPAFDTAAALGRRLGYTVISPAEMDRAVGFDETTPPSLLTPAFLDEAIRRDINAILNLSPGDGLALLPGWERSRGCAAEVALARWRNLNILCAVHWKPLTISISLAGTP
jgi:hypothetical protein